jgi:sugar O-acyltransferase (sialic acid O-acetyltransferase NeuD family)
VKRLAIYGASGHGKVVADVALACGYSEIVFFDDRFPELSRNLIWPVLGDWDDLLAVKAEFDSFFVAVGDNSTRCIKLQALIDMSFPVTSLVHPSAILGSFATVSSGCVVMPGAILNASVAIGVGGIINTASVIEHDCRIGDFVHVGPNCAVGGGSVIGDYCWIGIGATISNNIELNKAVVVGAGAVVVKNIAANLTVVGCPASPIKKDY